MTLDTVHFGQIEVTDDKIITFRDGILGFDEQKKYVLITNETSNEELFCWLQSIDDPKLAFVLVDAFKVIPDYSPEIDDNDLSELGISSDTDFVLLNIVVIPDDVSKMTVNLLAPIILNMENMKGKQIILNGNEYNVRHYILEQIRKYKSKNVGE